MVGTGGVTGSCVNRSMPAQNGQRGQVLTTLLSPRLLSRTFFVATLQSQSFWWVCNDVVRPCDGADATRSCIGRSGGRGVPSETRHGRNELVGFDRLPDVHLIARRKRSLTVVRPRVRCQRKCGHSVQSTAFVFTSPDLLDERVAILLRQSNIRNDHVRPARLQ